MVVYGIILAAGEGRRAGGNKLSSMIDGKPMLYRVLDAACRSTLAGVIMVTGHERAFGEQAAAKYGIPAVFNSGYSEGMSSSLKLGIKSLPEEAEAFAILLGDMPYIKSGIIDSLIDFYHKCGFGIVVPVYKGRRGHPPIISVKYKGEILEVSGDMGARQVINNHPEDTSYLEIDDSGIVKDVDYLCQFKPYEYK